jgi:hypothetical protein
MNCNDELQRLGAPVRYCGGDVAGHRYAGERRQRFVADQRTSFLQPGVFRPRSVVPLWFWILQLDVPAIGADEQRMLLDTVSVGKWRHVVSVAMKVGSRWIGDIRFSIRLTECHGVQFRFRRPMCDRQTIACIASPHTNDLHDAAIADS